MQQDQMQEIRQTVPVLPEDLTTNVTTARRLVLQSGLRGVLRAECFDVESTEEKHSAAPVAAGGPGASGERGQEATGVASGSAAPVTRSSH